MLVRHWMSGKLISTDPESSMAQAGRLLSSHQIGSLPVIDSEGRLVGIISDRDIKGASASDATSLSVHELAHLLSKVKVGDIMTPDPLTINEYCTIELAARIMLDNKVSGLPVLDDLGKVIGMITKSDIFRALIMLTGAHHGGVQIGLDLPDEPGGIKQVTDIIRQHDGRILSILTSNEGEGQGRRKVFIRIRELNREQIANIGRKVCQLGKLLYLRDEGLPAGQWHDCQLDEAEYFVDIHP